MDLILGIYICEVFIGVRETLEGVFEGLLLLWVVNGETSSMGTNR